MYFISIYWKRFKRFNTNCMYCTYVHTSGESMYLYMYLGLPM